MGSTNGVVWLYYGSPTGLQMWDTVNNRGLLVTPPLLTGSMTGRLLGRANIAGVGDVNGDGFADFIVSSVIEGGSYGGDFLFYGCGNGMNNSAVTPGCPSTGIWACPRRLRTWRWEPPTPTDSPPLSSMGPAARPPAVASCFFTPTPRASYRSPAPGPLAIGAFGRGGVGDVNKDGYSDVVQGTWSLPQYCTSSACPNYYVYAGGAVLFTGSSAGLMTAGPVTRTPSCNGGICTPYWVTPSMANWGVNTPSYYDYGVYAASPFNTPTDTVDFVTATVSRISSWLPARV